MNEGNPHPPEDWWTNDQKALICDVSSLWIRKAFSKVPGIWVHLNAGGKLLRKHSNNEQIPDPGVLDNTAWDHEHCALCRQKISEFPTDQPEVCTNGSNWLCIPCYDKYKSTVRG